MIIRGTNGNVFLTSAHGPDFEGDNGAHVLTCQYCHGGADDFSFNTMDEAHTGMVADPSAPGPNGCLVCHSEEEARSACDGCHTDEVTATANSLHTTLAGYITAIEDRCGCEFSEQGMDADFNARCAGCHTTCGQCHISRPKSVGGGFPKIGSYYSHKFAATPDMNEQCIACHGSRIGFDYKGGDDDHPHPADIHRSRSDLRYKCEACHTKAEIHGDGNEYAHRYEVANMVRCEDCHEDDLSSGYGHIHHTGQNPDCGSCHHHGDTDCQVCHNGGMAFNIPEQLPDMQCQVCHSQPYKNCTNCHNLLSAPGEGEEHYEIDDSVLQLKIAQNPSPDRDYDFALVRHTPVDPGTFENWGLNLPDYTSKPTWQYTSPHNIQRLTAQTAEVEGESCSYSCHQSADGPEGFLLRESDLYDDQGVQLPDYDANDGIVIREDFPAGK